MNMTGTNTLAYFATKNMFFVIGIRKSMNKNTYLSFTLIKNKGIVFIDKFPHAFLILLIVLHSYWLRPLFNII